MGVVSCVDRRLAWCGRMVRRILVAYAEWRNIYKKRELIHRVHLTSEQQKEVRCFFKQYYGKVYSLAWHRLYTSYLGVFCKEYFPEILFSTKLEPKLNPYTQADVFGDKNLLPLICAGVANVHVPRTYIACVKNVFRDGEYVVLSSAEVYDILCNIGHCVIKKTVETNSGKDVEVCNFIAGCDVYSGKSVQNILNAFGEHYVVQELIRQADCLARMNVTSVNTFRVISYIISGQIHVCPIALRVGRAGAEKDNIHYGGIGVGVNADGTLKPVAFSENGDRFECHPDSRVKFAGYDLGQQVINRLRQAAVELHARIPQMGIVSWDFSLNEQKEVVVLEVNTKGQGVWLNQMVNGESLFGEDTGKMLELIR